MEFQEAHINLRAIRLLYRLLEDNSIALQDANSDNVIERARVLLKSLLDVAVEVVFETHLKITGTQTGISKTISNAGGTNSKTLCSLGEENGMMQQNLFKGTNQSNEKGMSPSIESDNHEQQHNCEHAKESLQIFDVKAGESINESNNVPLMNDIGQAESNSSASRLVESLEQKGDFSDDLVNTIKRIESRMLAFQLCSNMVDSNKKDSACHYPLHREVKLGSPKMQRKDSVAGNHSSCRKSFLEGHRLMNQQTDKSNCNGENLISAKAFREPLLAGNEPLSPSQEVYQNYGIHTKAESAKSVYIPNQIGNQLISSGKELRRGTRIHPSAQNLAMIDRVKSLNRLVSGDAHMGNQPSECIQGLRVPFNQDDLTKNPSMFASQPNRQNLGRKTSVAWSKTDQNQKGRSYESSHAQKLARSTPTIARKEKPPPHQMVIRPTLLDQRSSEIKVSSHQHRDRSVLDRRETHKTGHVEPRKTIARPQLHESEESSSIPDSSSQWTSQQGSTNSSNRDSEDSLAVGTQGPKSGRIVDTAYEGSSEESSDSYLYRDDSLSHRVGSIESYRHRSKRSPKKTIGSLKRLKNKLGLIFHHHHHHHHHHHYEDDDDNGGIHSNAGHRHSMWNHLQNVFHHKNKHGMLTNKKVEKTRRGAITRVLPRSNQVGQFHRLVEGLLRHIRHSKKPKPSKHSKVKGSRNTPHGHSQKKLHWWQILRRRRGVKLKNRGRVKMGFISQKSLKN